jgi:hypothetical protein
MELHAHGTIEQDGCKLRFTESGQWLVSLKGTFLGYIDTLAEAGEFIAQHKANVKARLEEVEAQARARVSVTTCDICGADWTENVGEGSLREGDWCPSTGCGTGTLITH